MAIALDAQLTQVSKQSRLDILVDDILIHILSLLPVWDVLHVRQTSKRMEALSHLSAVWRALFSRDVVTSGRPIPGFSFSPTPRLLQLCALDLPDPDHIECQDTENYDVARELVEASDLEARTLCALRLDKIWSTPVSVRSTSISSPYIPDRTNSNETRVREFQTPAPVHDFVLLPGGRFVVSLHADRLRCWDLGGPHVLTSAKSDAVSVKCVGELLVASSLSEATMCMDTRVSSPSISACGRHTETNISLALCPVIESSWNADGSNRRRTCEILSVSLDPLRSDVHGSASGSASLGNSPFASPVPFFRHEASIRLPVELITPSYPEGSVSAQTMVGPQWGPQRFASGKLGKLLLVYGSTMFLESFVPPQLANDDEESGPKYVGIEALDWNDPTNSVLFEYPDPQVGPFVGIYVHASASQVLVVWENCAGLYPLPFRSPFSSSTSSLSRSGSTTGSSSASPSRPSTPTRSCEDSHPCPEFSSSLSPLRSSPGSSRSSLHAYVSEVHVPPSDIIVGDKTEKVDSDSEANCYPEPEPKRTVTMPTIVFALSEAVEAPIAFSLCSIPEVKMSDANDDECPHALTIVTRSHANPSRKVQSVLTATPNPYPEGDEDRFTFRLSRIPSASPEAEGPSNSIKALALGRSGRGVRTDAGGAIYRCTRAEVVLPMYGYGLGNAFGYGFTAAGRSSAMPTVDFSSNCVAYLPEATAVSPLTSDASEVEGKNLVLQFDDGMGRVVVARVPKTSSACRQGISEIAVLDFA